MSDPRPYTYIHFTCNTAVYIYRHIIIPQVVVSLPILLQPAFASISNHRLALVINTLSRYPRVPVKHENRFWHFADWSVDDDDDEEEEEQQQPQPQPQQQQQQQQHTKLERKKERFYVQANYILFRSTFCRTTSFSLTFTLFLMHLNIDSRQKKQAYDR